MLYAEDFKRFMGHVNVTEGCWLWTASTDTFGYGQFWTSRTRDHRKFTAHRFMLAYLGKVPERGDLAVEVIDHLCNTPRCVNPDHLQVTVQQRNTLRSPKIGAKTHCARGHEYTLENTEVVHRPTRVHRRCRQCHRDQQAAYARRRAAGG